MTAQEHEAQGSHEQSLTADEKLQRVRDGLSGATRLKYMMDELAEEIDKDKENVDSLNAALASKQTRYHVLRRERESLVGLEQLAEVANRESGVINGEEAIDLALAIYEANGSSLRGLSDQEIKDRFHMAKKGQEVGVFSIEGKIQAFGPLVKDAEVVVDRHAIAGPIRFRVVIGREEGVAPISGEVSPQRIAFGKEDTVERYIETVTDEDGNYFFEEGVRGDYRGRLIDALEAAAAMIKWGLCENDQITAYHSALVDATNMLIEKHMLHKDYGELSDLSALLEELSAVIPPEEFSAIYDSLIYEAVDPEHVMTNAVFKDYLYTMERLTARMQNPEKDHLSNLDKARARVTVLEAIEAKRESLFPSEDD